MSHNHSTYRHRPYHKQVTVVERRISYGMLFVGLLAIVLSCWLSVYLFQWVVALAN